MSFVSRVLRDSFKRPGALRCAAAAALLVAGALPAFSSIARSPSSNVIVIYGTEPGGTAIDCASSTDCDHGPVSEAMAKSLDVAEMPFARFFDRANAEVRVLTASRQALSLFATDTLDSPICAPSGARKAIVLGNAAYTNLPALKGPRGDVTLMATKFRGMKFDVSERLDQNLDTLIADIGKLTGPTDDVGTLVVYYAGHGLTAAGKTLIPATLDGKTEDLRAERGVIVVQDLIDALAQAKAARKILILDTYFPAVPGTINR